MRPPTQASTVCDLAVIFGVYVHRILYSVQCEGSIRPMAIELAGPLV